MLKKNRIILLIDFSKYTDILCKTALSFVDILNADVVLVHQVSAATPGMASIDSREKIVESAKQEAFYKLTLLSDNFDSSRVGIRVSEKNILTILEDLADEEYFDWVFAGVKGTGILRKLFIGSTTINVIDNTHLLTVAIPLKEEVAIPRKLIMAVNYKYPFHHQQLHDVLKSLTGTLEQVEFVTVVKDEHQAPYKAYLDEVLDMFKEYKPSSKTFESDDAFSEIRDYIRGQKDTYLVVQQGSRTFADTLFRKFMINELVFAGSIPLIVLSE